MATKTVFPRKNNFSVTGLIVKNDAYVNQLKTVAHFRIAACSHGVNTPSCFFDCVQFGTEKRAIDASLLKKGTKVDIEGYFHMNTGRANADGTAQAPKMELVVTSVKENLPVEIEIPDNDASRDLPEQEQVSIAPLDLAPADLDDLPDDLGL